MTIHAPDDEQDNASCLSHYIFDNITSALAQRAGTDLELETTKCLTTLISPVQKAAATLCIGIDVKTKDGATIQVYGPELHDIPAEFLLIVATRGTTTAGLVVKWPEISIPSPLGSDTRGYWWQLIDQTVNQDKSLDHTLTLLAGRLHNEKTLVYDHINRVKAAHMTPTMVCLCYNDDNADMACGLVSVIPFPPPIEVQVRALLGESQ